ncbi:MAG: ECF transporter S component [Erysipelotrichaceae bacterium]|nr:ECF transporter S component [Erysipelotrichaceae bacterium]MDD3809752.1 ECF transporter S component [Erysipelotrichaceae bacterium]
MNSNRTRIIALNGLFIALCYIGTMFNITFNFGGAKTMIHFGNVFCLLGALVLGGVNGGIAASIGMGLFDLTNGWVPYAPSTFILKFVIALIAGTCFTKLKIANERLKVVVSCASGMLFNFVFSPIASFLTSHFILNVPKEAATIFAGYASIAVVVNAIMATIIASILYFFLAPALKKINLKLQSN